MQYKNMNGFLNHSNDSNQFLTTELIGKGALTVVTFVVILLALPFGLPSKFCFPLKLHFSVEVEFFFTVNHLYSMYGNSIKQFQMKL